MWPVRAPAQSIFAPRWIIYFDYVTKRETIVAYGPIVAAYFFFRGQITNFHR